MNRNLFLILISGIAVVTGLGLMLSGCQPKADALPPLRIAAAADLKFALDTLLREFREKQGAFPVEVTYGSSGNLRAQIENGAPFDLFLSADMAFPEQLIRVGVGHPETLFPYAVGRLVVWAPKDSPIEVETLHERALLHPSLRKIAIANPEHAPYGQAAVAALKSYGVFKQVEPRFVLGENVAQTAQFIESGAADIGIIALSLAKAPTMEPKGRYWEIPLERFPRMLQGGVMIRSTKHPDQARTVIALLQSAHGREVLQRYGFILPGESSAAEPEP